MALQPLLGLVHPLLPRLQLHQLDALELSYELLQELSTFLLCSLVDISLTFKYFNSPSHDLRAVRPASLDGEASSLHYFYIIAYNTLLHSVRLKAVV